MYVEWTTGILEVVRFGKVIGAAVSANGNRVVNGGANGRVVV